MGALYNKMERDLRLKNFAQNTQDAYLRCCRTFVRYHMKSPTVLGTAAIKEYLAHLLRRGAAPETLRMHVAGLKFLYGVTLERPEVVAPIPWPKAARKKPNILSGSEVEKVLGAVVSLVPRMALMTALRRRPAHQRGVPPPR
jgi:site-specific recombinase XerD